MRTTLRAIEEREPGPRWCAELERLEPAYREWFLREGDAARPGYLTCRRALRDHMPELEPIYERLVDLAGGGDLNARLLSLYCPTPYLAGCSQAVWTRSEPMLVRNYDYSPRLWDATLWHTAWSGMPVIAMGDCLWGVLDGMNEAGLVVSLAFGGRKVVGEGFGIPLVLRYILETCDRTHEATAVLERVPSHMSYNITIVDADGAHATVFVAPDRPVAVTRRAIATNHQHIVEWRQFAHATATVDREVFLGHRANDPEETRERFVERFQQPPLFCTSFARGWGTLYTAIYEPQKGRSEFRWPHCTIQESFDNFVELELPLDYSRHLQAGPPRPLEEWSEFDPYGEATA